MHPMLVFMFWSKKSGETMLGPKQINMETNLRTCAYIEGNGLEQNSVRGRHKFCKNNVMLFAGKYFD
jgi:hypothetical protein